MALGVQGSLASRVETVPGVWRGATRARGPASGTRVPAAQALGNAGRGLSLQIPEEHDLESQILKEREWRFLRNARVRRQARRLIQKGEGAPEITIAGHRSCAPAHFTSP